MEQVITIRNPYGSLQVGAFYPLLKEGGDWYLLKYQGRALYAPRWVDNYPPFKNIEHAFYSIKKGK